MSFDTFFDRLPKFFANPRLDGLTPAEKHVFRILAERADQDGRQDWNRQDIWLAMNDVPEFKETDVSDAVSSLVVAKLVNLIHTVKVGLDEYKRLLIEINDWDYWRDLIPRIEDDEGPGLSAASEADQEHTMREIDIPSAFFADRRVARLDAQDRLIFLALMVLADEKGRLKYSHIAISQALWGGEVTPAGVEAAVEAIHETGLITIEDAAPEAVFPHPVIQINDWDSWQPHLAEGVN